MSSRLKDLPCGCRAYVGGAGATEGRCPAGMRLEAELVEAAREASPFDGSKPRAEQRSIAADRALLAHDGEDNNAHRAAVEFRDDITGAHARITEDELIVFIRPLDTGPGRRDRALTYTYTQHHYPLEIIESVSSLPTLDGRHETTLTVNGEHTEPGLTFSRASKAGAFKQALTGAIEDALACGRPR